jgi:hypothetical protein
VAWLAPELDCGAEPELMPLLELELLLEPELELLLEPEELLPEPELEELLPEELLPEDADPVPELPLLVDVVEPLEPLDVDVWWVEPGSTSATTPAVATLATPTAVVVERTFVRPRSRAATARMILSRSMASSWVFVLEELCGLLLRWL